MRQCALGILGQQVIGHLDDPVEIVGSLHLGNHIVSIERHILLGLGGIFGIFGVRLGSNGLVDFHTLLVLRHVAAAHGHFAIAHRQVERHARVVGVGGIALGEDLRRGGIVLIVESVAALYLVNLGNPAVRLGHLVHVAVKLGQLGRLLEVLQRLVVILGLQRTAAQHEIAFGQRRFCRSHHRSGALVVHALVDDLFELGSCLGEILCPECGGRLIVNCRDILRRERYGPEQRNYRY